MKKMIAVAALALFAASTAEAGVLRAVAKATVKIAKVAVSAPVNGIKALW